MPKTPYLRGRASLAALCLLAACHDSGGSSNSSAGTQAPFELLSVSFAAGDVLFLNQEIELEFSAPIEFSTVSLNTILLRSAAGASATGTFELAGPTTVVFVPNCPTRSDYSDAGLQPRESYELVVVGTDGGAVNTVHSARGAELAATARRGFTTPASDDPALWFEDTQAGPPLPVVRGLASSEAHATHVELGRDPARRVYFEVDPLSGDVDTDPPGFQLPLNLYADVETQVAFVVVLNQSLDPASDNLDRIRLQVRAQGGVWIPFAAAVEVVANCRASGAVLRLEPFGLLPREGGVRAVLLPGLRDLVGEATTFVSDGFALADVGTDSHPAILPEALLADELFEPFDTDTLQDLAVDGAPAIWRDGKLRAETGFSGTGGPDGDFDWVVRAGDIVFFDTTETRIVGGPNGVPVEAVTFEDGVVDVNDLIIEEGGTVRVLGPNPLRIQASGDVLVYGLLDISGFDAPDVATLNTGNFPVVGGAGGPAGGRGGNASEVRDASTPCGERGHGPRVEGAADEGGEGGESGYAPAALGKDARRPGGGGGGRFAADACDPEDPDCLETSGLFAEKGFDGSMVARGAKSGVSPPAGGPPGSGPFVDGDPSNDFFGVGFVRDGDGNVTGALQGELAHLWAGYGGGGAGDAVPSGSFPGENWAPGSDEQGGGGGGGGGALRIQALGEIVLGPFGEIRCVGGRGASGENTIFLDHIGGSGGSGSGGHAVLESAERIVFLDGDQRLLAVGGPRSTGAPTSGGMVSHGGSGGPGVIQLHVPRPLAAPGVDPAVTDIVVPAAAALAGDPLAELASPVAQVLNPSFGSRSRARSRWIPVGEAADVGDGTTSLVEFLFDGIETGAGPDEGKVLTRPGPGVFPGQTPFDLVTECPPLLGPDDLGAPASVIEPDGVTLALSGAALAPFHSLGSSIGNDVYLRTPDLLREFVLRLSVAGNQAFDRDFVVAAATYDEAGGVLRLVTPDSPLGNLQDYFDSRSAVGTVQLALIPRFFRVIDGGEPDILHVTNYVRILFQATGIDVAGEPEEDVLVDWTADVSRFNALAPGELRFFRFDVEFELDALGQGLTPDTKPIELDFLRIPFRF